MGAPRVVTASSWFDDLGGSEIPGSPELPFLLRVLVAGYRVTPRHSMFQFHLEMGVSLIPKILRHEPLGLSDDAELLFVLPERWMSVHEQHSFLHRLKTHPEAARLKRVDIITQEALVVGSVSKGSLATFQISDSDPEAGLLDHEMR